MKVYVAGHGGLVGSALVRVIEDSGEHNWIGQSRRQLDLLDRKAVFEYVLKEKPDWVIIAAAKVGGIHANSTFPVEFLSENLQIETNLIDACHAADIERVLFLGSSCIYPKACPQPIKEEYLLTGPLEPTNEPYALAKISGLKLIQAYRKQYGHKWISAMPTNLYGPGDNFDFQTSHVLPAMIAKFHAAKVSNAQQVSLWGTGTPKREFLHVDDLARACLHMLSNYDESTPLNIGSGSEIEILDLAHLVNEIVGFKGAVEWDTSQPDGTPRKVLDCTRIHSTGWSSKVDLHEGIASTYEYFIRSLKDLAE